MDDLDTLREWATELGQGSATVTVEMGGARYTIPHASVEIMVTPNYEFDESETKRTGHITYRQLPGYRVEFSGDTRFRGGDDQMTREVVGDA